MFSKKRLFRRKKRRSRKVFLAILAVIFLFLAIFLAEIFFGKMGKFARKFPKFFHFSAIVLLQNDAEIRPTGGFLSGFFVVEIKNGIPKISFFDSYSIAPPPQKIPALPPISKVFSADPKFSGFVARDANFFPDFPQSAAEFLRFLKFDPRFSDKKFDAVIAVNFSAIEDFLQKFGAVGDFSAENVFFKTQILSKKIDLHDGQNLKNRKSFAADFAAKVREKIGFLDAPKLLNFLTDEANKKNVQFFFRDPDLQKIAADEKWDGALPDRPFFGVNLANLGAKKSDRFSRRLFFSEIFLDAENRATEHFRLSLENFGGENLFSGDGFYFVRIFRPAGTTFSGKIPPNFSQKNFKNFTEFSTTIFVPAGKKVELSADFSIPDFPKKVLWHAQSGAPADLFWSLSGVGQTRFFAENCRGGQTLFCERKLPPDAEISLLKVPDATPPFLENYFFTNDREIFLRFSEEILPRGEISLSCGGRKIPTQKIVFSPTEKRDATLALAEKIKFDGQKCALNFSKIADVFGNSTPQKVSIFRRR